MVARKHNEGGFIKLQLVKASQESPHLLIIERDFAVVRMAVVACQVRVGRTIRAVRVIEMHPQKKRPGRMGIEPRQSMIHRPVTAALEVGRVPVRASSRVGLIVIGLKAAVKPPH
jgi:hypothetical protein